MVVYKALSLEQLIVRFVLSVGFVVGLGFFHVIIPANPGLEFIRLVGLIIYSFFVVIFINLYMGVGHYEKRQAAAAAQAVV